MFILRYRKSRDNLSSSDVTLSLRICEEASFSGKHLTLCSDHLYYVSFFALNVCYARVFTFQRVSQQHSQRNLRTLLLKLSRNSVWPQKITRKLLIDGEPPRNQGTFTFMECDGVLQAALMAIHGSRLPAWMDPGNPGYIFIINLLSLI